MNMINQILLYFAAGFTLIWGIAHLVPTKSVVKGFGDITQDNKRIITMEWINEGVCLIFMALLILIVTIIDSTGPVSISVYWLTFIMLNILSIISLFTGFKIKFLPFKLCPLIFTTSSLLILAGTYI